MAELHNPRMSGCKLRLGLSVAALLGARRSRSVGRNQNTRPCSQTNHTRTQSKSRLEEDMRARVKQDELWKNIVFLIFFHRYFYFLTRSFKNHVTQFQSVFDPPPHPKAFQSLLPLNVT